MSRCSKYDVLPKYVCDLHTKVITNNENSANQFDYHLGSVLLSIQPGPLPPS